MYMQDKSNGVIEFYSPWFICKTMSGVVLGGRACWREIHRGKQDGTKNKTKSLIEKDYGKQIVKTLEVDVKLAIWE